LIVGLKTWAFDVGGDIFIFLWLNVHVICVGLEYFLLSKEHTLYLFDCKENIELLYIFFKAASFSFTTTFLEVVRKLKHR